MTMIERYAYPSTSSAITVARVRMLSTLHQQRLARIVSRSIDVVEEVNAALAQVEQMPKHVRAKATLAVEAYIDAECRAIARL